MKYPTYFRLIILACLIVGASHAALAAAPSDKRVLIISIDGLRADLLLRADSPRLHALLAQGTYTMWAQTTAVAVTIPSHVSMLTGARPQIHQIEWNHDLKFAEPVYPTVPTLFELAHKAGYSTGMVAGKAKFDVLNKPGTLDHVFLPENESVEDDVVRDQALHMIEASAPQVLFVHLPSNDHTGHALGWGSPEQMNAIAGADAAIGSILDALKSRGLLDHTLIIISADHGGAGKKHGADDVRSRCIPWIAVGPNVRHGVDLTTLFPDRAVRTEDTFATACDFLGVPFAKELDGKPVREIYVQTELLAPVSAPATQPAAQHAAATLPPSAENDLVITPAAVAQTELIPHEGDAADDPAIWVHPDHPEQSLIIGTDKKGALHAYDLDGHDLQAVSEDSRPNNVDVIYGFNLAGLGAVDLAYAGCRSKTSAKGLKFWAIDPATRKLRDVTAGETISVLDGKGEPYGSCVFRSAKSGKQYVFIGDKEGHHEQYEVLDAGDGKVGANLVRKLTLKSETEGSVADDARGVVYIAEESVGIWRFDAEPDGSTDGKLIARVGEHGLKGDVEGLTLYRLENGKGYLIASSQGNSTYKIYERDGENRFVASFEPSAGKFGKPTETDGVDAVSAPLGSRFPHGLLVVQDGTRNPRQNFKLYNWDDLAGPGHLLTGPAEAVRASTSHPAAASAAP